MKVFTFNERFLKCCTMFVWVAFLIGTAMAFHVHKVEAAGDSTVGLAEQFKATSTPIRGITQRTPNTPVILTGYAAGCAQFTSTSTLISTGTNCGGGGGGSGTVTSVALTVPTGLTVSGSPVTTSGTLAISLGGGYVIPLVASTTEWATAYGSTTALTPAYIRSLFSGTTPILYSASTGVFSFGTASTSKGGTGTTTIPSLGQVLVGLSDGTYGPVSTSSLGIISNGSGTTTWLVGPGFLFTATSTDGARAAFFTGTSTTASSTFASAVGIGTTTPFKSLTVAGEIYASATTTSRCFTNTIGGTCITGSGGGISSLNGQTGSTQTFATGTATGIGLNIVSATDTHTFTPTVTSGYFIPLIASGTEWATAYASTTALTPTYIRGLFSANSPISYNASTGVFSFSGTLFATTSINGFATTTFTFATSSTGGDISWSTSTSAVTLNVPTASATNRGALSSTDWSTFNGKQAAGNYITALTGDGTASGPGSAAFTLATVNSNVGSFGGSTAIPNFTVNAKGLITAAGTNVVIAPAGTLTGTTLAANVVTSSLTTVGTIGTGVWQGTAVGTAYGGTGTSTQPTLGQVLIGLANGTYAPMATSSLGITGSGGSGNSAFTIGNGVIYNATSTDLVGIGTTTPVTTLFVQGKGGTNPFAIASSTGTQLVTLTQAGNLGIGTQIPTDVNANARLTVAGPGSQDIIASTTDNTTASDAIIQAYAPGSRVFMGAHGTNQVSTRYGLTLGAWGEIGAFNSTSGTTNGLIIGTNPAVPVVFGTNNLERMRIISTGNIGIATTTPARTLSIAGDVRLTGAIFDGVNASGTVGMVLQTTATSTQWVATSTLGITGAAPVINYPFTIGNGLIYNATTTDKVGIGTSTPASKLEIQGSGALMPLRISSSSGTSILEIETNGNIGIGSTTPAFSLVVASSTSAANYASIDTSAPITADIATFGSSSRSISNFWTLDYNGHVLRGGEAPTVGTCGTSPSITSTSTDDVGRVTPGTSVTNNRCTINFARNRSLPPKWCFAQASSTAVFGQMVDVSTSTVTFGFSGPIASIPFGFACFQ